MSVELILPRIDGVTTQQQLLQLKSCLFQMREQLQFALNNLSADNFSASGRADLSRAVLNEINEASPEQQTQYQELSALVVKTAHTVNSVYEEVSNRLNYEYVAQSEYGDFRKWAELEIRGNADNITQYYDKTSELKSNLEETEKLFDSYITDTNAYIRTGLLYENQAGVPFYGVEIGQKTTQTIDGQEVVVMSDLVSRFTSDRLSFFQGETEVAYISNQRLYITDAEIMGSLSIGKWRISTTNGFTLRYAGND